MAQGRIKSKWKPHGVIKDIIDHAKKEISESLIVTENGVDTVIPLGRLKKRPLHVQMGSKTLLEVRYQGKLSNKPIKLKETASDAEFFYYRRNAHGDMSIFKIDDVLYLKSRHGDHQNTFEFCADDLHERHKIFFGMARALGYKVCDRQGKHTGYVVNIPKKK